jgi:hypothetical protein
MGRSWCAALTSEGPPPGRPGSARTGKHIEELVRMPFDVTPRGFAVRDVVAGITLNALQAHTEAKLHWT